MNPDWPNQEIKLITPDVALLLNSEQFSENVHEIPWREDEWKISISDKLPAGKSDC